MSIQPSLILKMIDVFENYNLKPFPTLKYIELNGEVVTEFAKKRIKSFFNIPIANMYGANEVNGIALECPNGHMHILEQNVFVDIRKDNHNNNTILVTSLKNTVTPIINYDLGDLVELDYIDCKCGERGRIVKIISYRFTGKQSYSCISHINFYHSYTILCSLHEPHCIRVTFTLKFRHEM